MEEYKSNSYRSRTVVPVPLEEVKKKEKIIAGTAKVNKKSGFERFWDTFKEALGKVWSDIVVPAAKKSLSDGINNMTDMMIYGEAQPRNGSGAYRNTVSYKSFYENRDRREPVTRQSRVGARDYDDIVLETRGEADAVLNDMRDTIETYQYVRVADLYDLVGLNHSYTDNNYGWDNLSTAYVERVRDGYLLKLPRPMPID